MILLTARGAFASEFMKRHAAVVASNRELPRQEFIEALRHTRTIIHNAASISCGNSNEFLRNNYENTKDLVDLLTKVNPAAHLINIASMSFLKDDRTYLETAQMTPYAHSKYLAERYCLDSCLKHVASVRFSTLFYMDPTRDGLSKLICDAVKTRKVFLLNNGDAKRDFIPLHIAVEFVRKITEVHNSHRGTWNIVSGKPVSYYEITQILKRHIDGLEIFSTDIPQHMTVVSSFDDFSVNKLGRIDYSLEDEIKSFIRQVMDENSHH